MKPSLNNKFLTIENIKFLNEGDVFSYYFDTQLNGRKKETVKLISRTTYKKEGVYGSDSTNCEHLLVEYITPECFAGSQFAWIIRPLQNEKGTKGEWNHFVIWCNGWNSIRIKTINGKCWDELMIENKLNIFSEEEIHTNKVLAEVEKLKKGAIYLGKIGYKEVYKLNKEIKPVALSYKSGIYANANSAFSNLCIDKAKLTHSGSGIGISQKPFIKEIQGIGLSTRHNDYEMEQHFVFVTGDIDAAIAEVENNVSLLCERKETSLGMCWVIPNKK